MSGFAIRYYYFITNISKARLNGELKKKFTTYILHGLKTYLRDSNKKIKVIPEAPVTPYWI